MPSIMVNIQIELVTCLGDFVPEEEFVLSILHYYLHSVVVMIEFGGFCPQGDFILGKILSPTHALLYFATIVFWRILNLGRFCPLLMPSIMVNIQIELVTCLGDFVLEEDFVLSLRTQFRSLFKLLFQLEDFVLGRILSQGEFYSKEFYPILYFIQGRFLT